MSSGQRQYCIPYANFPTGTPFDILDADQWFTVKDPYRQTQATLVGFLKDGFAGMVPAVVVDPTAAPVRDLDGTRTPTTSTLSRAIPRCTDAVK